MAFTSAAFVGLTALAVVLYYALPKRTQWCVLLLARCSAVAALAGGMLKLHPRIVVVDGAMDASKKYRGKLSSVILSYTRDMEEDLKNAVPDRVFITHSGCDREIVEAVRSYLESLGIFDEILETRAGGVVSSHCGPGTLGVLFIAK